MNNIQSFLLNIGIKPSRVLNIREKRQERVRREGSPVFIDYNDAILAGEYQTFDLASLKPASVKYFPLDTLVVMNNDVVDIAVMFDSPSNTDFVPAGTTITFKDRPYSLIVIQNQDAAIAATADKIGLKFYKAAANTDRISRGFYDNEK